MTQKIVSLCACGCGRPTRIATKNDASTNRVIGRPMKFILGHSAKVHGHASDSTHSATYSTWHMMIQRCTNPKAHKYYLWGGSGIKVCERWLQFENFLEDMGNRDIDQSIHRIDASRGYCKDNCIWLDKIIHGGLSGKKNCLPL